MSDTPRDDDPDEPTIRRPRLFGSGARDNDDPATDPAAGSPGSPAPTGPAATPGAAGAQTGTQPAARPGAAGAQPAATPGAATARPGPQSATAPGAAGAQTATPPGAASARAATPPQTATTPSTASTQTATTPSTASTQTATTPDATSAQNGPQSATPAGTQTASAPAGTRPAATGSPAATDTAKSRQQRKRRLTIIGIASGAALVVIALCVGAFGIVAAIHDARSSAAEAQESRRLRDADCLELETRLNRLTPPGATGTPVARATAVQDENAAVRIYLTRSRNQRDADAWRQLVDARTAYAESLQQQAKTRTPAFYVAPRTNDGRAVADQLAQWSPAPCAGAIRRLAAPDL